MYHCKIEVERAENHWKTLFYEWVLFEVVAEVMFLTLLFDSGGDDYVCISSSNMQLDIFHKNPTYTLHSYTHLFIGFGVIHRTLGRIYLNYFSNILILSILKYNFNI